MNTPPTSDSRVRHARVDDRRAMLELWERSVRATHSFLDESDIGGLRPLVATELASDTVDWWVLEADAGVVIGFLGFANDAIEGLFIDPDHLGRGAGKALVSYAQQLAAGALAVDVNEHNQAALGFYTRLGFTVVGRSAIDANGLPFPILHMRRPAPVVPDAA